MDYNVNKEEQTTGPGGFGIYNQTNISLGWKDRIRVLFGRNICLSLILYASKSVDIVRTESAVFVKPLLENKAKGRMPLQAKSIKSVMKEPKFHKGDRVLVMKELETTIELITPFDNGFKYWFRDGDGVYSEVEDAIELFVPSTELPKKEGLNQPM